MKLWNKDLNTFTRCQPYPQCQKILKCCRSEEIGVHRNCGKKLIGEVAECRTDHTTWIQLHLVFEDDILLKEAHDKATVLERKLIDSLDTDAIITIHLEPYEAHEESHDILEGASRKKDSMNLFSLTEFCKEIINWNNSWDFLRF